MRKTKRRKKRIGKEGEERRTRIEMEGALRLRRRLGFWVLDF